MKSLRKAFALALLSLAPPASFASIITYDFTVTGGSTGPLAGVTSNGYFSYDDSRVTPNGQFGGVGAFSDFLFTWDGVTYDESIAEPGSLSFDANGVLRAASFAPDCVFLTCVTADNRKDWYVIGFTESPFSLFSYSLGNSTGFYTGSFMTTLRTAPVPEPGMLPLLLAGLGSIGVMARRRQRARR